MGTQSLVSWSFICGLSLLVYLSHQKLSRDVGVYLQAVAEQEQSAVEAARIKHLQGDQQRVSRTASRRAGIEVVFRRPRTEE